MADGALTIILDDETLERLRREARDAGVPVENWVADWLRAPAMPAPPDSDVARWRIEESLKALAEYDRTGESVGLDEALAEFHQRIETRLAKRA